MYSPEAHREFVQGFRKRKQERRQKAKADIEAAEKQARRDSRREKREFVREHRKSVMGHDSSSDEDETAAESQVTTFAGEGDSVVTAVVQPMEISKFEAPRRTKVATEDPNERGKAEKKDAKSRHAESKDAESKDAEKGSAFAKMKKKLGVKKTLRKHGKRRVSYTHALSKGNLRKKKLKQRKEEKQS